MFEVNLNCLNFTIYLDKYGLAGFLEDNILLGAKTKLQWDGFVTPILQDNYRAWRLMMGSEEIGYVKEVRNE